MSITTYDELKTAVARWLKRDDLTAYIPDYIALGEHRLWYGDKGQFPTKPLRLRVMVYPDTGTVSNQYVNVTKSAAYPYLETQRLSVSSGGKQWALRYLPLHQFAEYETLTGDPKYYTFVNNSIKTAPSGAASFQHDYYAKPLALSASNTTTTEFLAHPNLYLLAACVEGALDTQNDAQAARFAGRLQGSINALQDNDNNVAAGGSLAVTVAR